MVDLEELLLTVFMGLHDKRVPLGVSEYLAAIKAVRETVDADDLDSVRRWCCLLWAKSTEDQELFDDLFTMKVEAVIKGLRLNKARQTSGEANSRSADDHGSLSSQEQSSLQKRLAPNNSRVEQGTAVEPQTRLVQIPLPRRSGHLTSSKESFRVSSVKYHLTPRLPMDRRDMSSIWRHLRRTRRDGPLEELDVQGTIDSISRTGVFLGPVLQPRRRNQARLVLLIDQRGSMAPFSLFIEAFVESILRGGLLGQTSVFYFHDCPEVYFYQRPTLLEARPVEEVLKGYCQNNSVLIVSDAGAARAHYDQERVCATRLFLNKLSQYTYLYAWLNPMPEDRWTGTTAGEIAHLLPMYQLDREGLNDIVNILRGQPFPPEFSLNE